MLQAAEFGFPCRVVKGGSAQSFERNEGAEVAQMCLSYVHWTGEAIWEEAPGKIQDALGGICFTVVSQMDWRKFLDVFLNTTFQHSVFCFGLAPIF